jgi:hypothetical protein
MKFLNPVNMLTLPSRPRRLRAVNAGEAAARPAMDADDIVPHQAKVKEYARS